MSNRISEELLTEILENDTAIGTVEQLGSLLWSLAREVAEYRRQGAEQKLTKVREWLLQNSIDGELRDYVADPLYEILNGDTSEY